jgi:5'-3' exonuclease
MNYLIVDTANTFFRARHAAHRATTLEEKVGFAIHVTLSSIYKAWRDQKANHVVICLEGRSWRKDYYEPYKKNRAVARAALTDSELEEDRAFWQAFDDLKTFFYEKSNCTVLRHENLEADDLVAGWIQSHPLDKHVIVSSDTDYYQLLADNVTQYNGVSDELHTLEGIFDYKGKRVIDKKTKEPKVIPDPKWLLFEKCMRGDVSDNVFSAYPGVRVKGSKNKVGLQEAFADMDKKGFNWNNLMLQRWVDHHEQEHRVLDDYERNCTLIDLSAQPDHVKAWIAETIAANALPKSISQIGVKFMKFCGKHQLVKIGDQATQYTEFLSAEYPQKVNHE